MRHRETQPAKERFCRQLFTRGGKCVDTQCMAYAVECALAFTCDAQHDLIYTQTSVHMDVLWLVSSSPCASIGSSAGLHEVHDLIPPPHIQLTAPGAQRKFRNLRCSLRTCLFRDSPSMFLRLRAALGEGVAGSFLQQSRGGNSREGMELDFKGKIFQVFPCFCCLARMCLGAEMSKVTKIENFRILPLLCNY